MRFAIDAHAVRQQLTGNEVYIRSLLRSFCAIESASRFVAYLSKPDAAQDIPQGVETRVVSPNPFVRLGWQLRSFLRQDKPDLLHVQYTAPLMCPVPLVVSVHDVSFLEHPQFFSTLRQYQLSKTVPRSIRAAAKVLTCSEFSKDAIERHYPEARGKTVVVHNAVASHFRPMNREQAREHVRRQFGFSAPFVLNVGDLQPRKNQQGLIHAFEELIVQYPRLTHHLVLVGQSKLDASAVRQAAAKSRVSDRIHLTGWVDDDQLQRLYCAAELFAFPSFYEGFGIPILEAMACGCAVVCSKTSAMPEVADGASIFFDPHSPQDIMRALRDVLLDSELRARMERLGLQRAAAFSWNRAAAQTLEVFHSVAGGEDKVVAEGQSMRAAK